ncbi:MAG: alpha/beta hydrolase, partial [Nonomuraea sp.]|nr:alpha/beta hydrolase [Nonomuraea sp.]
GDPSWGFIRSQAHTVHYDVALFPPGHGVPAGRLAGITAPTLVLDGGASPGWFHSAALAVAEAVPGAESVTIDGEDHGVLARPEHLLPELTRFFAA